MKRFSYAPSIAWQNIAGEVVVVEVASGRSIGLNPTASFLWLRIPTHDTTELARALAGEFDVSPEVATADVEHLAATLVERGLLVTRTAA